VLAGHVSISQITKTTGGIQRFNFLQSSLASGVLSRWGNCHENVGKLGHFSDNGFVFYQLDKYSILYGHHQKFQGRQTDSFQGEQQWSNFILPIPT